METKNLTKLIIKQQISSKRLEKHIHRSYVLSKQRDYDLCWEKKVNGSVTYNGNIYLLNYQTWFHGCYLNHKPHFMNTNIRPKHNTKEFRIVDVLLYQSAVTHLNDQYGLKNGHYKECIFALTDRGYLRQYFTDCSSGTWKLHRKIYLSRKYGFKNLSYDKEFDRFVIKSIHDPNGRQSPIRFYFALFYPAPFSFIGIFGLKDELFGKIQDAFLVQELLVITTKKKTLFYDFKQLLDINTFEHININKTQFGTYPNELPINIEITQLSPCLFILETSNMSSLSFGGYPYHCILQKGGDTSVYFVHSAPDAKLIGKIEATSSDGFDSRFSYFHTDQSGRIVCVERDRIDFIKIVSNEDNELRVDLSITFDSKSKPNIPHIDTKPKYTSSGRLVKTLQNESEEPFLSDIVHSLDYHESLDILAVLFTKVQLDEDNRYAIGLYDNQNGCLLKEIVLDLEVNDAFEWNLFFDDIEIIMIMKSVTSRSQTSCFIYRLTENIS